MVSHQAGALLRLAAPQEAPACGALFSIFTSCENLMSSCVDQCHSPVPNI